MFVKTIFYAVAVLAIAQCAGALSAGQARRITVVFRYDDFSARSPVEFETQVIHTFAEHGVAVSFGVIPFVCDGRAEDPSPQGVLPLPADRALVLTEAIKGGRFEVAMHGYSHHSLSEEYLTEFDGLPLEEQRSRMVKGKRLLEELLKIEISTFIPPWNSFEQYTLRAAEEAGFRNLSASGDSVPTGSSKLRCLPATCGLPDLRQAVEQARTSADPRPVVVVLLHGYDFRETLAHKGAMDRSRPLVGSIDVNLLHEALHWVSQQPDVQTRTLGEVCAERGDLSYELYKRWCSEQLGIPLLMAPALRTKMLFYPQVSTLDQIRGRYHVMLVLMFCGIFLLTGLAGFGLIVVVRSSRMTMAAACAFALMAILAGVWMWQPGKFGWRKMTAAVGAPALVVGGWLRLRLRRATNERSVEAGPAAAMER
jgi:peptidoglycan/xylan/chitin deacetylase (PgdA/CDA1 family)